MRISGGVTVHAPLDDTWLALADIASHVEWMADAESITFTSDQTQGAGTRFECVTKVGPLRTTDKMTVVAWVEHKRIGVRHTGIVEGSGVFELAARQESVTDVTWTEDLKFPWFLGGGVVAFLARPVLKRLWMGNLKRFGMRVEQQNR